MSQDPVYHIEKMSESVVKTKYEDIDKTSLKIAKLRVLDLIGCAMFGSTISGSAELASLAKSWGGKEESTIYIFGGKVTAQNAALVNSAVTRMTDYEAIGAFVNGVELPSHISSTTVFTALAVAEAQKASGKDLLAALLVGDDVAGRILYASGVLGGKNFEWGWDGNGTVNAFGATATAGNLLKLTGKQMQNAFGLILNQLSGTFQNFWDYSLANTLTAAFSARNGIFSAELAKAGWDGPYDPLFSKYGYFFLFTEGCTDEEILTKDIGKTFYSEATFKPFPSCRSTHAAIECAQKLIAENDIDASQIQEATIRLFPRMAEMFTAQPFSVPRNPAVVAANSIPYAVANILLRKESKIDYNQEEYIRDPKIAAIAGNLKIAGLEPHEFGQIAGELIVKMKDGKEYSASVKTASGGYLDGLFTDDDVRNKFRYNLEFSKKFSKENGEKIIAMVENLENMDNISELTKLLV